MPLTEEDRKALINYRIDKAFQVYIEAQDNAQLGHWSLAANRLYYALFHISSALLIAHSIEVKSHNGLIRTMGMNFVRTGILSSEDGRLIANLQRMRQSGDYDDLFDWSEEDVKPLFEPTNILLQKIRILIMSSLSKDEDKD